MKINKIIDYDSLEKNIETGDIGLSVNDSFLARSIRFFMKLYMKIKDLPSRQLFNHSFHFLWIENELFVAEALAEGGVIRSYRQNYFDKNIRHKIKKPFHIYNDEEKENFVKHTIKFFGKNKEYNFMNFPFQIFYVLTGGKKWYGKKGKAARKRIYCTEATATCVNSIRDKIWNNPWSTNPLDIDLAPEYINFIDLT